MALSTGAHAKAYRLAITVRTIVSTVSPLPPSLTISRTKNNLGAVDKRSTPYPHKPLARSHPHGQYLVIEQSFLLGAMCPGVTLGRERILRRRPKQQQQKAMYHAVVGACGTFQTPHKEEIIGASRVLSGAFRVLSGFPHALNTDHYFF